MATPVTRYFVQFRAANNMGPRFIGEGATMPWKAEEARLFETKAEALAAFKRIGAHHISTLYPAPKIRQRSVIIVHSVIETMLTGRA